MATTTRKGPASRSVYRGQSRRGIGEGPGSPILHGEQYLAASPDLAQDGELLEAIRPWMSLDSDPEDHRRLADRLEGWSCFRHRGLQYVVRLASAGIYDRRAAYFSHGRAWPVEEEPGFDPGLLLGCSAAFERPWRDDDPGERVPEPFPAIVRPDQVAAELETARLFLAHCLQSCVYQRPLIVACQVSEFAAGAPLHALVSFARGALPADLRKQIRVRIYTRTPELFLRDLGPALAVVPEEIAGRALGVRREASLIDRQGMALAGEPLETNALAYAEAVIERALRIPDGLTQFTERFRDHRSRPGMPSEEEARAVQVTYNLAVALAGPPEERGDLLRNYLPRAANKLGADLNWQRLITAEDWRAFPKDAVLDLLLMDSGALSGGVRALQKSVEQSVLQHGWTVDSRLANWWDAGEDWKLRRLLELAAQRPPLISSVATAERTISLPIGRIVVFKAVEAVLSAELNSRVLGRRSGESSELGELAAASPEVLRILLQAVETGVLGPKWVLRFLERIGDDRLPGVFPLFLAVSNLFDRQGPWQEIPRLLLDRLRGQPLPRELAPGILQAGLVLEPAANLPAYLRLADLQARIDGRTGTAGEGSLVTRLWQDLHRVEDAGDRELLLEAALSREWRGLQPASLASQGKLRQSWMEGMASRLIAYEDLLRELDVPTLLRLARHLEDDSDVEPIFDQIDARMSASLQSTTDALIREGGWGSWRRGSRLAHSARDARRAAEAWLTSRAWTDDEAEATLEDWKQVMRDLPGDLSAVDFQNLWGAEGARRFWPWIPPFEEDQLSDLSEKAADLTALADLTQALIADPVCPDFGEAPHLYVLRHSRFHGKQHVEALGWLQPPDFRKRLKLSMLDFRSALQLRSASGPRGDRAREALVRSTLNALETGQQAEDAIRQAEDALWSAPDFLAALAAWMVQRGSVQQIGKELLALIDRRIAGASAAYPKGKQDRKKLVGQLVKQGYKNAARLLDPALAQEAEKETLVQSLLDALEQGSRSHGCWKELSQVMDLEASGAFHPLASLAEEIRRLPEPKRRALEQHGWSTFEIVARSHTKLMNACAGGPLPAFDLAAVLSEPGGLGLAASRIVSSPASKDYLSQIEWWESLLRGLSTWRRYSASTDCPDDRPGLAILALVKLLGGFKVGERQAFWSALKRHADNFPQSKSLLEG